uniref:Uncharacterized protein n=1 Tax=Romanomermis culicivorax TaxID=13658 RepID=A0A915IRC6_ROMCU
MLLFRRFRSPGFVALLVTCRTARRFFFSASFNVAFFDSDSGKGSINIGLVALSMTIFNHCAKEISRGQDEHGLINSSFKKHLAGDPSIGQHEILSRAKSSRKSQIKTDGLKSSKLLFASTSRTSTGFSSSLSALLQTDLDTASKSTNTGIPRF